MDWCWSSPAAQRDTRVAVWLASVAVAAGLSVAWSMDARNGANEHQKELSANGLYSLGYAFTNNEIGYYDFYATRSQTTAEERRHRHDGKSVVELYGTRRQYPGLTPNLDRVAE